MHLKLNQEKLLQYGVSYVQILVLYETSIQFRKKLSFSFLII